MPANSKVAKQDAEKIEPPDTLGCYFALVCAIVLPLFTRFFHWLLIPQVLEESAYFVGKAPYILMYMVSVPTGLILGMTTAWAWWWRNKNPQKAQTSIVVTGLIFVFFILRACYSAYVQRNIIPGQANLPYMLSAYLPWYGPIFLWACLLLCWSWKIGKEHRLAR